MITVRVEIDRQTAILKGRAYQGTSDLALDGSDLETLTLEERELLACMPSIPAQPNWATWRNQRVAFQVLEPTKPALFEALRKKLAELQVREEHEQEARLQANADRLAREEKDAARVKLGVAYVKTMSVEECLAAFRHVSGYGGAVFELKDLRDPTGDIFTLPEDQLRSELADMRALRDRLEAEAREKREAHKAESRERFREVIHLHGTPLQLARWNEGLCPEQEAIDLQREVLFRAIDLPRYVKIDADEIDHTPECYEPDTHTWVGPAEKLTDAEYLRLVQIRALLPEGYTMLAREHRVWCGNDDCEDSPVISKNGVHVKTTWNEIDFSREFALDTE